MIIWKLKDAEGPIDVTAVEGVDRLNFDCHLILGSLNQKIIFYEQTQQLCDLNVPLVDRCPPDNQ